MTDKEKIRAELEEAAKMYAKKESYGYEPCNIVKTFRVGAKWQKQQMMKNAKEGVITFDYYGDDDKTYGCIAHDSFSLEELGLKDGDKVKLIIIKEGKQ